MFKRSIKTEKDREFYRKIYHLVTPIVIQNLLSAAVGSADVIMLNYVGQSAISAVSSFDTNFNSSTLFVASISFLIVFISSFVVSLFKNITTASGISSALFHDVELCPPDLQDFRWYRQLQEIRQTSWI